MKKCTLNAIKDTFQASSVLLTTKSALTVQYCTLRGRIKAKRCAL